MKTLGILVGGGPAPGINGVIAAATIEARNHGLRVLGILDGFKWLTRGDTGHVRELEIAEVSRIHFDGGSILRTSRENPARSAESIQRVVGALRQLGVSHVLTIGGDDTAFAASRLATALPPERASLTSRRPSTTTSRFRPRWSPSASPPPATSARTWCTT
jgi:6-phosphofructokinase